MMILNMSMNQAPNEPNELKESWQSIGEHRITAYCPECNEPSGYQSSSGKKLESGDCACSWLPIGTEINIEGEPFVVVDKCGTDAIDIFIDSESCQCNLNDYRHVSVKR